jgi:hypothetical protein
MPGLSDRQLAVIRTLVDTAPDAAIRSLDSALSADTRPSVAMAEIRDMISAEAGERRARNLVLAPVARLCPRTDPIFEYDVFPARTLSLLWRALKQADPGQFHASIALSASFDPEEGIPEVFNALTALAAAGLRDAAGTPFAACAALLDEAEEGAAEAFADYLDLAPLARAAQRRLPDWLAHMTSERIAQVRLAFKDATDLAPDAGPRFLELLISVLDEPWLILRVVSALMDRPTDVYLASSELAHVGDRLLADIDRRLDDLNAFDPFAGPAAGVQAAEAARLAVAQIGEFDLSLDLKKDGPWGQRIGRQKQLVAQKVEALLNKADDAVDRALPLKAVKFGTKTRGAPAYRNPPDERAVVKAQGMLTFLHQIRTSAAAGGYASLRNKTIEKLNERLDRYVEDVLEHLRTPDIEDGELARQYLDIAATLVGLYRDEKAAQIVRRRAAA